AGGISAAVQQKILMRGVMHACVRHDVDIVLTGAIRDEGPIPGVTTDIIEAQKVMRQKPYALTLRRLPWSAWSSTSPCNQSAWSQTWNRFCESSPSLLVSLAFASKLIVLMRELLLCPPDYYGIEYEINPWMS